MGGLRKEHTIKTLMKIIHRLWNSFMPPAPPHWALSSLRATANLSHLPSHPSACVPPARPAVSAHTAAGTTAAHTSTRSSTHAHTAQEREGHCWAQRFLTSSLFLKREGVSSLRAAMLLPEALSTVPGTWGAPSQYPMNKWTRRAGWCLQLQSPWTRKYSEFRAKGFLVGRSPGKLPGGGDEAGG